MAMMMIMGANKVYENESELSNKCTDESNLLYNLFGIATMYALIAK